MNQLLFTVIFSEMALIMLLLFKTPLRKLVIMGLDRLKRGRAPLVLKTVAGTVLLVLISSVYSMMSIQKRMMDDGSANPTDQVLMAKHLLEASLMGNFLFLFFLLSTFFVLKCNWLILFLNMFVVVCELGDHLVQFFFKLKMQNN